MKNEIKNAQSLLMSNPPRIQEALTILNKFDSNNHPSAWVISYLIGFAHYRGNDFPAAVKALDKAVKKGGNSLEVYQLFLDALMKIKQYNRAKAIIPKVLNFKEDDVSTWRNLAEIYCSELNFEDALIAIGKANNFAPSDLSLSVFASKIYAYHGKYVEALKTIITILNIKADYTDALLTKAFILNRAGKNEEALEMLIALYRKFPEKQDVLSLMGDCYQALGRIEEALSLYRKIENHDNIEEDLILSYAKCLMNLGITDEARTMIESLLSSNDHSRKALKLYAEILKADKELTPNDIVKKLKKYAKNKGLHSSKEKAKPEYLEGKKLNIGILSDAFYDHEIGRRWAKLLNDFPKELFSVTAFYTNSLQDEITRKITSNCAVFNLSHQISPVGLTKLIDNAELDIIIDASSGFNELIDHVLQNQPAAISIASGDRELEVFESHQYDIILSEESELPIESNNKLPVYVEFEGNDLAEKLFTVYRTDEESSNKHWKRNKWQQNIALEESSAYSKEYESVLEAAKSVKIEESETSNKIIKDEFWLGLTDTKKAVKIIDTIREFPTLNSQARYLDQIVSEAGERLEQEPTDNVAFFIQTMALLSKKVDEDSIHQDLKGSLKSKQWQEKTELFKY